MRLGVFTFFNDEGIGPVELAAALEHRGFGSLFVTEHSHIPVNAKTRYPMGGPIPPPVLQDPGPVHLADRRRSRHRVADAGHRHRLDVPA